MDKTEQLLSQLVDIAQRQTELLSRLRQDVKITRIMQSALYREWLEDGGQAKMEKWEQEHNNANPE